ncbi:MAG: hypothetical protein AAFV43_07445 [Planctomycetota bacterium]
MLLFLWAIMPLITLGVIEAVSNSARHSGGLPAIIMVIALPICVIASTVALHAQSLFADPRARVLPGYAGPHVVAIGLPLLVAVVGVTAALTRRFDVAPLGVAASATLLIALLVWAVHAKSSTAAWVAIVLIFADRAAPVASYWYAPGGGSAVAHAAVLAAGLVGVGAWLRSLCSLNEASPRHHIPPLVAAFSRASRGERAEQRRLQAAQAGSTPVQAWFIDRQLDSVLRQKPNAPRLLRLGFASYPAEVRALWLTLLVAGLAVAFVYGIPFLTGAATTGAARLGALAQPLLFACFMPGAMLISLLAARRSLMEMEVLRPLTREAYFRAMIGAALYDVLYLAAATTLVTTVLAAWLAPEEITLTNFLTFACLAAASNLFVGAVAIWIARLRLGILMTMVPILPALPVVALIGVWARYKFAYTNAPFLAAAGVVAALGWLIVRDAHRRWMQTELA